MDELQYSSLNSSCTSQTPYVARQMSVGPSPVDQLPRDIMHRIFMDVITNDDDNLSWITEFSCVSRRWWSLCQHPIMWEFVAKRLFPVYPLVVRLESTPWDPSSQEHINRTRLLHAAEQSILQHDPLCPLRAPTRTSLRRVIAKIERYRGRAQYYKYVQRRRSLVLHLFLSATLLSLSLSLGAAMCAAEGVECLGAFCTRWTVFTFLWLCYICIIGIIVSNVVMEAHFEPMPLLPRLRKNKSLIATSAATVVLGICDVMIPTVLVQVNLSREEKFSWMWCGATVILTFCIWQSYTLFCLMPEARVQLQQQMSSFNVREGFHFVVMNVPNAFPLFFAAASVCTLQYVQYGNWLYTVAGSAPVTVALGVLALVFLLDFVSLRRSKDLCVGLCLLLAMFFPISLLVWDFRGWCLAPLVLSAFGFCLSHAQYVVRRTLADFLCIRKEEGAASAARSAHASSVKRP